MHLDLGCPNWIDSVSVEAFVQFSTSSKRGLVKNQNKCRALAWAIRIDPDSLFAFLFFVKTGPCHERVQGPQFGSGPSSVIGVNVATGRGLILSLIHI